MYVLAAQTPPDNLPSNHNFYADKLVKYDLSNLNIYNSVRLLNYLLDWAFAWTPVRTCI